MQFKPLATLVNTLRGWLRRNTASQDKFASQRSRHPISTFRRLEKRRVFAVDAFFNLGALNIEITGVGQTNANLLSLGTDFFVDNNNNQTFEIGEVRGLISDLQSVYVHTNGIFGKFVWSGDFSAAPLSAPIGTGEVVRAEGLSEVVLQADLEANGNVSLDAYDSIYFDSQIVIQGDLSVSTQLSSMISDGPNTDIIVTGDASLQSTIDLKLADEAGSSWRIVGRTRLFSFGDIELGQVGNWDTSALSAIGNNVSVLDQNDISLNLIQSAGQFKITAFGTITDDVGANIAVVGKATLEGTSITLADSASDSIRVTGSTFLVATTGAVSLDAAGTVFLDDVSASGTDITLFEDSGVVLASIQASGALRVSSFEIASTTGSIIQADSMALDSSGFIRLADDAADVVTVSGRALLIAADSIEVASPGVVNFGSLGLFGADVVVYEDSETQLDGSFVVSLFLQTRTLLTQSGIDTGAGTTVLQSTGDVTVSLLGATGSIDLYRESSNPTAVVSDGRLLDNRIDGVFTAEGIHGDVRLRNSSTTAFLGSLSGVFDDLTIWHTRAAILLRNQDYDIQGNLELIAGVDVQNPILLSSNPLEPVLATQASIMDVGSRIIVGGNVNILASDRITLSNSSIEFLRALSGATSVVSFDGQIDLGRNGQMQLSHLGVSAINPITGQQGDVYVQVDSSVSIINPTMPNPDGGELAFSANHLTLQVNGNLSTKPSTQLVLVGNLIANASGNIALANNPGDEIEVGGITNLVANAGSISLGISGQARLNAVSLQASLGDIVVGGSGQTELGLIDARAVNMSINEDAAMVIRAAIADDQLVLASGLSVVNTVPFDSGSLLGISARSLTIDAGTFAHLGLISVGQLSANVQANGALTDFDLFALNANADQTGRLYLDAIGQNLPPGIQPIDSLLSGETIDQLRARASFLQTFGNEYGLFVQNDKMLTVESVNAIGDGVHVLIETAQGWDLIVQGGIQQQYTQSDPGGVVLIAGDQLLFAPGVELRIEHVSGDVATSRVVRQPSLIASAFDGGRGPAGYESTRDVLYAADEFANTNTQNTIQRVATQFGIAGEAGFQTLIQYADGSAQLFDQNQELSHSRQSNSLANTRSGVIPAFVATTGDVAGVERIMPFADEFLGRFQTLPTTAIFRRAAEFFLFERSGDVDASLAKVDLTPVVDPVADVFSPGRKISFSLPTEIIVTPPILVAPIRVAPEGAAPFAITTSNLEPSVLSEGKIEVFIVNVGFEDVNQDGQVSDPELPTRDQIMLESVVLPTETIESSASPPDAASTKQTSLLAGEVNSASKDVKSSQPPSSDQIEAWMAEYRDDPNKPSGAYAVISVDNVQGAKVLKVFGVHDFEITNPEQPMTDKLEERSPAMPDANAKEQISNEDKSSSVRIPELSPIAVHAESNSNELMNAMAFGLTAGTLWTVSGDATNRFGRIARTLRAVNRKQLEGENAQVS